MRRVDIDWLLERPVAHRGLHDGAAVPENSLAAFRAAADRGFPIELDVRLSADGKAVVYHDERLGRLTGERGTVARTDAARLASLRLLGTPHAIPLLEDALAEVSGRAPLLVEIKNEGKRVGPLEEEVCRLLAGYGGRAAVQSFNPASVEAVAALAPSRPRGLLFSPLSAGLRWPGVLRAIRRLARRPGIDFAGCDVRGLPYRPVTDLARELPILGWTVRSERAERAARRWVDNVIFEGYVPRVG